MSRLVRQVRQFMASWPGAGIVGVSGGADSVALLRALTECEVPVTVAHVNHALRGADSDADETFVLKLCDAVGVQCRVKRVDVRMLASGANLEATARRVRYDFFSELAEMFAAQWIATAHTADDQAETVLHRLIRGTGLQGLRGILSGQWAGNSGQQDKNERPGSDYLTTAPTAHSSLPTAHLLRPLLTSTRADVLDYLTSINQQFREDASNADPRFTRNRIRHELLPLLKSFNPDVVSALMHLAEHANEAHEVLTTLATELLAKAERPRAANTLILDAATLAIAPRAVVRVALRLLWEREGWPMNDMGFDAWERAVEIAAGRASACDFPGGVTMRAAGRVVQVGLRP